MASDRAELARKEMLRTEEGRARLEREAYEAKPKGECPNCRTILPLDAESCTNATCGATFFAIGGWRIKPLST